MPLIDARQHVTNPEGWRKVPKADIVGKAAHHSVSGTFFMAGETTEQDEINHIRMIDQYHVSIDYGGFAYHACGFPSGRAYQTGDFDGARAHVWGRNHELLGWVLIGDYQDQLPSASGLAAAAECERAFNAYLGREVPLKGHRDWALPGHGTACPGRVRERLSTIRNLAKEDDMTPEEIEQAVLHALTTGPANEKFAKAVREWCRRAVEEELNKREVAGTAPKTVKFPGATIKVPPVDMPVE
jgi:hypothetical protein